MIKGNQQWKTDGLPNDKLKLHEGWNPYVGH